MYYSCKIPAVQTCHNSAYEKLCPWHGGRIQATLLSEHIKYGQRCDTPWTLEKYKCGWKLYRVIEAYRNNRITILLHTIYMGKKEIKYQI